MKTTIIFEKSGSMYLTVAYKPGEVTNRSVKPLSTMCITDVTGSAENGYSVRFLKPYFRQYDRKGFMSVRSAINYEQDILEKNLDGFISSEPEELFGQEVGEAV